MGSIARPLDPGLVVLEWRKESPRFFRGPTVHDKLQIEGSHCFCCVRCSVVGDAFLPWQLNSLHPHRYLDRGDAFRAAVGGRAS